MKVLKILINGLIICLFTFGCRELFNDVEQTVTTVQTPVEASKIIITSPKQGSIWKPRDTMVVEWINNSIERIDIRLYRKSVYQFTIDDDIKNIERFSWKIPDDINPSNHYILKIINHNNTDVFEFSARFGIQ